MNTTILTVIKALAEKSTARATSSHDALHYTQAALNLAHVVQVMKQIEISK